MQIFVKIRIKSGKLNYFGGFGVHTDVVPGGVVTVTNER
jgi:hypothetical protein